MVPTEGFQGTLKQTSVRFAQHTHDVLTVIYTRFGKHSQDEAFFFSHDNIHRDYKELIDHLYKIHVIILYLLHSLFNINHLITPHTDHKHLI